MRNGTAFLFRARGRALWAAVVLVATLQIALFHSVRHDDAFITFRYGQNLASGHGLVFNPGENLMGSTSPEQALLSAFVYRIVGRDALPSVMSALGCLGWLAQALAVVFLLMGALGPGEAVSVGILIAAGAVWSHRFVALETNLAMALVLWALVCGWRRRFVAGAIVGALAGLARPDAYLVGLPLGILWWRDTRGRTLWPVAAGFAVSLPWFLFAWLFYGSIVPHSAVVKTATVPLGEYSKWLLNYPAVNLLRWRLSFAGVGDAVTPLTVAVWAIAGLGAYRLVKRDSRLAIVPATLALYAAAYLALRAGVGVEWHLYPVMAILGMLAVIGAAGVFSALPERLGRHVAWSVVILCAVLVSYRTIEYSRIHGRAYWYGARDEVYRRLADAIRQHTRPGDVIVADEVGTLAYYSDHPVVDLERIVTSEPAARLSDPAGPPRWFVWVPAYRGIPAYEGVAAFEGNPGERAVFFAESQEIDPGELNLGVPRFSALIIDAARP